MIRVQNLTKSFGPKTAVNGVSFTVDRGEVLGFLGPNGAGKSTTMRMITGFIPPSAGSVKIGEFDMIEQPIPAKRLIGYLPENAPAYTDMTVHGFLNFAAEYEINPHMSVFGRVDNLTGEHYSEVFGFPALGTAAYGGMKLRF